MTHTQHFRMRAKHGAENLWKTLCIASVALWGLLLFSDKLDRFLDPEPEPFSNVRLLDAPIKEPEGGIRLIAEYHKADNGCVIKNMVVFGVHGLVRVPLSYTPYRGPNQDMERNPGYQIMNIVIESDGISYQRYEVATQHHCGEKLVHRIMLRVPPL